MYITTTRDKGVCSMLHHNKRCVKWPGNINKYLKVTLVPAGLDQSVPQVLVGPYCLQHMGSCLGLPCWLADNKSWGIVVNNRGQLWDNAVPMIKIHFWLPWDTMPIVSWAIVLRLCINRYNKNSCSNKYHNKNAVSSIFFPSYFEKKDNIWNFYFGFLFRKLYHYYLITFTLYCVVEFGMQYIFRRVLSYEVYNLVERHYSTLTCWWRPVFAQHDPVWALGRSLGYLWWSRGWCSE